MELEAKLIIYQTMDPKKTLRTDGDKYIPFDKREGPESVVYFTRDLSAEGLQKIYQKVLFLII